MYADSEMLLISAAINNALSGKQTVGAAANSGSGLQPGAAPCADGGKNQGAVDLAKVLEWQRVQMRMLQEQMQAQQTMSGTMMAASTCQQLQPPPPAVHTTLPSAVPKASVKLVGLVAGDAMSTDEDWQAATEFAKKDKPPPAQMAAIKSAVAELRKKMHSYLHSDEHVNSLTKRLDTLKTCRSLAASSRVKPLSSAIVPSLSAAMQVHRYRWTFQTTPL